MTPTPPDLGALLERAKETLPWAYRLEEHDDWGTIRSTIVGEHGWCPVVANSRGGSGDDFSTHRANKTDPFEPFGQLIVAAVNAFPHSTRQAEREKVLREALEALVQAAENAAYDVNTGAMDEAISLARKVLDDRSGEA